MRPSGQILGALFIFILPLCLSVCRNEYTVHHKYYKSNCELTEVPMDIPAQAIYVNLGHNEITHISEGAFSNLTQSRELWLYHNRITHIKPGMFVGLESLTKLILASNGMIEIEAGTFSHLTKCTLLTLNDNELTHIRPDMFEGLQSLTTLRLERNSLTDLQAGSFSHLKQCGELFLFSSKLTHIKVDMFQGLQSVGRLDLRLNQISDIDEDAFLHLPQCTHLSLSDNKLTNIKSGIFKGLQSVEHLKLDNNGIYHIEGKSFFHLPQCNKLDLNDNKLTQIREDMFVGLYSLKDLDLSRNQISHIEYGSFTPIRQVEYLYLSFNKLHTLEQDMFSLPLQGELRLLIQDNPFQCDSEMCWIKQGEQDGWIKLSYKSDRHEWQKPDCENYPDVLWDNITNICPIIQEERYQVEEQTLGQRDHDAINVNVGTQMPSTQEKSDFMRKYLVFIVIGIIGGIVLLLMSTAFILYKYVRPLRNSSTGEPSPNRSAEVNKDLLSRQPAPLPEIPSLTYPRHYTTPLGPNDKYEVVKDGYEVPVNKRHTYITLVGEEDEEVYEEVVDAEV